MAESRSLDRRRHAVRPDLADLRLAGQVAATRFVPGEAATVVAPVLPLHEAPDAASMRNTEALAGDPVRVFEHIEARDGARWAWVQSERDGYVGYASADGLGPRTGAATHRVAVPGTFVYQRADIKSQILAQVFLNTRLAVVDEADGFSRIADGGPFAGGHLRTCHLAPVGTTERDFVAVAERFLDVPYLWGGASRLGLDCSALVQVAMTAAGLACPRDSDMQREEVGVAIDPSTTALQRGDLVFWRGHVGIMAGAATLLHANAFHMRVVAEPFEPAVARIASAGSQIIAVRRPERSGRDSDTV